MDDLQPLAIRHPRHLLALMLLFMLSLSACANGAAEKKATKEAHFHYQLASNHFASQEVPQAMRELDIALKSNPKHAEALHLMGFLYMGRKQHLQAVRYFKRALEARPDYYICMNNLGVVYLHLERWEEAAEIFEKLTMTTLYTSPWLAYANLGWSYHKLGHAESAIEQTEMALFLNPKMCLAANNLGIMYAGRAVYDKAVTALQDAIEGCPNYAEPHLHIGRILAESGETRAASEHFRQCQQLSPRSHVGERCRQYAEVMR